MKRFLSILLTLIMVVGLGVSAMAAALPEGTKGADKTISITSATGTDTDPKTTYTYEFYKLFDAVPSSDGSKVSYKLPSGVTNPPDGFTKDDAGNIYLGTVSDTASTGAITVMIGGVKKYITLQTEELTDTQIAAIKAYVQTNSISSVGSLEIEGCGVEKTVTVPEYGYYYITTTSGSAVTINTTKKSATVIDKNVIPPVEKVAGTEYDANSLKAIAQADTDQPFIGKVTKTHGAIDISFKDTMTNMTYNGDVKVYQGSIAEANLVAASNYTVTGAAGATTFTVAFNNNYMTGLEDNTVIFLTYTCHVTSAALSNNPATNKASILYGPNQETGEVTVEIYNAKITVSKKDGSGNALAGAGFVLQNTADNKYYKFTAASGTAGDKVEWYELPEGTSLATAIAAGNITEYTSDANGAVEAFKGLGAGSYKLIESTVPSGYNPAADSTFTISNSDFTGTNLELTPEVVNNNGATLPSTGGIGTTIFYVLGGLLAVGAGVVLVTKKRMGKEEN